MRDQKEARLGEFLPFYVAACIVGRLELDDIDDLDDLNFAMEIYAEIQRLQ